MTRVLPTRSFYSSPLRRFAKTVTAHHEQQMVEWKALYSVAARIKAEAGNSGGNKRQYSIHSIVFVYIYTCDGPSTILVCFFIPNRYAVTSVIRELTNAFLRNVSCESSDICLTLRAWLYYIDLFLPLNKSRSCGRWWPAYNACIFN